MRTIIVTGGTSGIGLGIVERLLSTTDDNVISLSRDKNKIEQVKAKLAKYSTRIDFYSLDITDEKDVCAVVKQI